METVPLIRIGKQTRIEGIAEYLLQPSIAGDDLSRPEYRFVVLKLCRFLQRDRPCVLAAIDEGRLTGYRTAEEKAKILSTPRVQLVRRDGVGTFWSYVQGDMSLFVPGSDDETMLFLRQMPPLTVPIWPDLISRLNAVMLNQVDEFIKVQTIDPQVMAFLDSLPASGQ